MLSRFNIDRSSRVPIYRQIDASLRRLIHEGALAPKQKLPSSRELAMELGVSRITVKSVYEQLVAEGYAQAKTGAGTFISEGLDFEITPKTAQNQQTSGNSNIKNFNPCTVNNFLKSKRSARCNRGLSSRRAGFGSLSSQTVEQILARCHELRQAQQPELWSD